MVGKHCLHCLLDLTMCNWLGYKSASTTDSSRCFALQCYDFLTLRGRICGDPVFLASQPCVSIFVTIFRMFREGLKTMLVDFHTCCLVFLFMSQLAHCKIGDIQVPVGDSIFSRCCCRGTQPQDTPLETKASTLFSQTIEISMYP